MTNDDGRMAKDPPVQPLPAWLEVLPDDRQPIQSACSLGRSVSNQVVLAGERVSRHHAVINAQSEQKFWLTDLGSVNGTWLNGRRITKATQLHDSDLIGIGPHRLTFRQPGGPPRSRPENSIADLTIGDTKAQYCWLLLVQLEAPSRLHQTVGAARVTSMVGGWMDQSRDIVENRAGKIQRYLSDGFLAYWCDHPASRPAVAEAVLQLTPRRPASEPPFRLVLHYGQVHLSPTAALGDEGLTGSALNFAFRLDKLASALKASTLVSEVARALLQPYLPLAAAGRHTLHGFEGEHEFYSVEVAPGKLVNAR